MGSKVLEWAIEAVIQGTLSTTLQRVSARRRGKEDEQEWLGKVNGGYGAALCLEYNFLNVS